MAKYSRLTSVWKPFSNEQPNKWHKFIPQAELWYNTMFHALSKFTPFEIVFLQTITIIDSGERKSSNNSMEKLLKERDLTINALKENLNVAQNIMKKADLKRRKVKFNTGEEVYLKLRPYRQRSLASKRNEKLAPKFYEPYQILEKIIEVAYRLELPLEAAIHNLFQCLN